MERMLEEKLSAFRALIQKIKSYEEALGVMYWDLRTGAPRKGVDGRAEVIGVLSTEMFRLTVSDEMNAYLNEFTLPEVYAQLDDINRKIVKECKKEYDRSKKIPPEKYQEYVVLTSQAESVWEQAKQESDFSLFRPYLEKIVKYNQEFIELWGYEGNKYNTLLDMYEPGLTVEKLDLLFGQLKARTVPLVSRIKEAKGKPDSSFLHQHYDKEKQREFSLFILKEMGYDFQAGRLDESAHPFATGLNPGDVRITTNFKPEDISFALFGTIHEGGHALYEQNLSEELRGTILCTGTSMGIHESQSRFWENFIGCGLPFWKRYFTDLSSVFPKQLEGIAVEQFYRAINEAEPSLIRIEADELTYNLHIMIRYEIEKALINDEIRADELPEVWNAKYAEYLGVMPSRDAEGVLQDVHWSGGSFGYFPSYALGNMYAAQIMHTLRREMPDLDARIERGELHPVKQWLTDKIYRYGKLLDPTEIILHVTGEELNPSYLADHLTRKFSEIYRLD